MKSLPEILPVDYQTPAIEFWRGALARIEEKRRNPPGEGEAREWSWYELAHFARCEEFARACLQLAEREERKS